MLGEVNDRWEDSLNLICNDLRDEALNYFAYRNRPTISIIGIFFLLRH